MLVSSSLGPAHALLVGVKSSTCFVMCLCVMCQLWKSLAPVGPLVHNEQCLKRGTMCLCELDQTQQTFTPSEGMPWRAQTPHHHSAGLHATPSVPNASRESSLRATAQAARRITPFPFLDAMESIEPQNSTAMPPPLYYMVHAHAQRSTSQVAPRLSVPEQDKMSTARYVVLLVAGALVLSTVLFAAAAAAEYVRPPPRRIILTEHTEPAAHPQQVHATY